jgi:mono/diheme cytochrome c family protein
MRRKPTLLILIASMLFFCSSSPAPENPEKEAVHTQYPAGQLPQNSPNAEGESLYIKYCLSCHQKDGGGVPNMFPPFQESEWVNGDKSKLINVLLKGLKGDIEVNGEQFSQVMPKQDNLTDIQIALILTYIRQNFGNNATAVTPDEVTRLRDKN